MREGGIEGGRDPFTTVDLHQSLSYFPLLQLTPCTAIKCFSLLYTAQYTHIHISISPGLIHAYAYEIWCRVLMYQRTIEVWGSHRSVFHSFQCTRHNKSTLNTQTHIYILHSSVSFHAFTGIHYKHFCDTSLDPKKLDEKQKFTTQADNIVYL